MPDQVTQILGEASRQQASALKNYNKTKLPSSLKPKTYKSNNYCTFYIFYQQLNQYIT